MSFFELQNIRKSYGRAGIDRQSVLKGIGFTIARSEALGLIGPSGSGKSTIARIALGMERPDSGQVRFMGKPISYSGNRAKRAHYSRVQMIWQDPKVYLNPFLPIRTIIMEPMAAFGMGKEKERIRKADHLMEILGLPKSSARLKAGQLSGGQCQRVAIARALSVSPKLLICDEALVSLDLPQQVNIIKILMTLQREMALSLLFISHDIKTVSRLCQRILYLDQGKIKKCNLV
ncbi:MAG: dipeptide/oligopeptide/nickel ABC transporter ATP-binding protein [Proteobacteria bacterium]|nr:dipeptide/oligopeptide/nickel ABC transporter ATP-binding protein [Pseudomonadota bacterium]